MPKCAAARRSTAEKGAVRCRAENVRTVCCSGPFWRRCWPWRLLPGGGCGACTATRPVRRSWRGKCSRRPCLLPVRARRAQTGRKCPPMLALWTLRRCADGRLGLCRGHGGAGYHFVCKMGGRARAGHNFRRSSAPDGRGHGRIAVGVRAGCGACAGRGGSLAAAQGLPGLNRRRQAKKPLQTQRLLLKEKRKGGEKPWTPDL